MEKLICLGPNCSSELILKRDNGKKFCSKKCKNEYHNLIKRQQTVKHVWFLEHIQHQYQFKIVQPILREANNL